MICTNASERRRSNDEYSKRSRELFPADFHSACYVSYCVSPLLPVCHEAALAPEEGGVPACGEDRRVASGTEGSLKWRSDWCMKAFMVCVEDVADAQNCATELPWSNEEMDAYCYQSPCAGSTAEELLLLCLCYYYHIGALFGILFKEWVLRGFYYFYGF